MESEKAANTAEVMINLSKQQNSNYYKAANIGHITFCIQIYLTLNVHIPISFLMSQKSISELPYLLLLLLLLNNLQLVFIIIYNSYIQLYTTF